MAILEERRPEDRAAELRQAQKLKSGMTLELKQAVQALTRQFRHQHIADEHLQRLIQLKIAERKFGRPCLTKLGRIVSML